MTANATRDKDCEKTLMAPVSGKIAESVLAVMQYFGIKKLEVRRMEQADYHRSSAKIEWFNGLPKEMQPGCIMVKDALSDILALTGIVGIDISVSEEEEAKMVKQYVNFVKSSSANTDDKPENTVTTEQKPSEPETEPTAVAEPVAEDTANGSV